ncbi:DUF547 domain-containing protein [Halovibrio salipaludis]|uniref:DUF547 domain-containing protein n=1 Tax=Halovibrio salipaludis TaxID=2032626 RepID=A0A2A2F926_9GAMM|nr:DUF547 domain-containing protein [Halovibrio salipaludis]PAU81956.1 DUF547 domain-containing protein [Halovibrio salipaludis]
MPITRYSTGAIMATLMGGLVTPVHGQPLAETYTPYQKLLNDYLVEQRTDTGGLVSAFDYEAALEDPKTSKRLKQQNRLLAKFDTDTLDSREKALAFWNNAYNYFMIETILTETVDGGLVDSVWDYGGRYNPFRDSVFQWQEHRIGDAHYSLDQIEKDILLGESFENKGWKEARVHFTVNCASVGCPPLRETLYTADNIERLMTENTRFAMQTERQMRIEGDTLYLSQLFDWYSGDFEAEGGSIRDFIGDYTGQDITEAVADTDTIRFIDYDWSLNKPSNFPELKTR